MIIYEYTHAIYLYMQQSIAKKIIRKAHHDHPRKVSTVSGGFRGGVSGVATPPISFA